MIRLVMAIMLAATVATAQDWSTLGALWVQPRVGLTLGGAVDLDGEYFTDKAEGLMSGVSEATVCAWIKLPPAGLSGIRYVVGNRVLPQWSMFIFSGKAYAQFYTNATGGVMQTDPTSESVLTTNVWHLMCAVKSPSNLICYIDSKQYGSVITGAIPIASLNGYTQVGNADTSRTDRIFIGLLDDACVFTNRSLSSNEVAELYGNGTNPKPATSLSTGTNGLVRYWKFDDGLTNPSATQAIDSVSGTYAVGTGIGAGDWTNGIVPIQ